MERVWNSCSRNRIITINIATIVLPIRFIKYIFSRKLIHIVAGRYDKIFWSNETPRPIPLVLSMVAIIVIMIVIIGFKFPIIGVKFPLLIVYEEVLKLLYKHKLIELLHKYGVIPDISLREVGRILRFIILLPLVLAIITTLLVIIATLCIRMIQSRRPAIEKPKYVLKLITRIAILMIRFSIILIVVGIVLAFSVLQPYKSMLENYIVYLSNSESSDLEIVMNIVRYVEMRINNSYFKPESVFEIDVHLGPLDLYVLSLLGFDKVHVILYQGWGSCGQYATVVEYILRNLGYETRCAHFVNIDHGWAEVRLNSTWYIIDPWYIGKYAKSPLAPFLVPTCELSSIPRFSNAGPIRVVYPNGTRVDATSQYGY